MLSEFKHSFDFDTNGLLYWIATNGGRAAWRNPYQAVSLFRVMSSSPNDPFQKLLKNPNGEKLSGWNVSKEEKTFLSTFDPRNPISRPPTAAGFRFFELDLKPENAIQPTSYSLSHRPFSGHLLYDMPPMRWKLYGSTDGKSWDLLKRHECDTTLITNATATWPLKADRAYRFFKLSNPTYAYFRGSFEIYGSLHVIACCLLHGFLSCHSMARQTSRLRQVKPMLTDAGSVKWFPSTRFKLPVAIQ